MSELSTLSKNLSTAFILGVIILKLILKKQVVKMWNRLNQFRSQHGICWSVLWSIPNGLTSRIKRINGYGWRMTYTAKYEGRKRPWPVARRYRHKNCHWETLMTMKNMKFISSHHNNFAKTVHHEILFMLYLLKKTRP